LRAGVSAMADFVQQSNVKSATRELAAPIADVATFSGIVQGVLDTNPFGCTAYDGYFLLNEVKFGIIFDLTIHRSRLA